MSFNVYLKEKFVFCHIQLYSKDIYDHILCYYVIYYDNQCSDESWSSLLMSPLAGNNKGACALRQSIKKYNKHLF